MKVRRSACFSGRVRAAGLGGAPSEDGREEEEGPDSAEGEVSTVLMLAVGV
jgi:hypothetical protein